jgi:hypothetical protein
MDGGGERASRCEDQNAVRLVFFMSVYFVLPTSECFQQNYTW